MLEVARHNNVLFVGSMCIFLKMILQQRDQYSLFIIFHDFAVNKKRLR